MVPQVFRRFKVKAATAELSFIKARELLLEMWNNDTSGRFPENGYLVMEGAAQFIDLIEPSKDGDSIMWRFSWCFDEG